MQEALDNTNINLKMVVLLVRVQNLVSLCSPKRAKCSTKSVKSFITNV